MTEAAGGARSSSLGGAAPGGGCRGRPGSPPRAGRGPGGADQADPRAAPNTITDGDEDAGEVGVHRVQPAPMGDDDQLAVAAAVEAGEHHSTGARGRDVRPGRGGDVDPGVEPGGARAAAGP